MYVFREILLDFCIKTEMMADVRKVGGFRSDFLCELNCLFQVEMRMMRL